MAKRSWMSADDSVTAGVILTLLRNMPADARREVLDGLDDESAAIVADILCADEINRAAEDSREPASPLDPARHPRLHRIRWSPADEVYPADDDPFGPEAYKSHRSDCQCWDCKAARQ